MKRLTVIVMIVLVLGFVAISIWKIWKNSTEQKKEEISGYSASKKAEIRKFWDLYRKASELKRKGIWQESVVVYQEALKMDPEHNDALYYLGNVFFELEMYEEAVATWRKLIKINPLSTRAHIQLGTIYSSMLKGAPFDLDIAEQEFKRAIAINKEQTGSIIKLGEVYLLKGHRSLAENSFKTVLKSNSGSVEAYYLLGFLKWQTGEHSEALKAFRKAVEFSRINQPNGIQLAEGDTKVKGAKPILLEDTKRQNIFASYWMKLKDIGDEEITDQQVEQEYRELEQQIKVYLSYRLTE